MCPRRSASGRERKIQPCAMINKRTPVSQLKDRRSSLMSARLRTFGLSFFLPELETMLLPRCELLESAHG